MENVNQMYRPLLFLHPAVLGLTHSALSRDIVSFDKRSSRRLQPQMLVIAFSDEKFSRQA